MPVANYKTYCRMLDRACAGRFAFPAINVTSLTTANAVLRGLAESKSDGIIQVSTGGGAFASGSSLKDMALGAIAIAEHVHRAAERYPIYVALHTDHCLQDKLDRFVLPLVEQTEVGGRRASRIFSRVTCSTGAISRCKKISRFPQSCLNVSRRTTWCSKSRPAQWAAKRTM